MAATREMARVKREIEALRAAVDADLRRAGRPGPDSQTLRSDIEICMQTLDELRNRLSG